MDEDQKTIFYYYQKSVALFKEIVLLMESLKYAIGKVNEKKKEDLEFSQKQIDEILNKIKNLKIRHFKET